MGEDGQSIGSSVQRVDYLTACVCPTRSLAAAMEDDILVTPPPSRHDQLRCAKGKCNALDCSCNADIKGGTPEHSLGGLPDRYATSPAMSLPLVIMMGQLGLTLLERVS